jgi:N-acetylneuraminic acid mutarotase
MKFNSGWERFSPDYPVNPIEAQAAIIGNDLFISGSFDSTYTSATNRSYARDISVANGPWRPMDAMPVAVGITHAALVAIDTKVYICGGYQGPASGQHVDTCFVYDHTKAPGTGQWSAFPSLPNNGTGGGAMLYDSGKNALYYTGGAQRPIVGSRFAKDVTSTWKFSFNEPSNGWVASTPIPYSANHQSVVTNRNFLGQERHFVLGGQKGDNEITKNVADMFEFVASNETWIRRASLPYERSHTSISTHALGCGFVIAGGSRNGQKLNRTSDIHYYDIPSNNWTMIGSLPNVGATPAVFIDDKNFMYYIDHKRSSRRQIYV